MRWVHPPQGFVITHVSEKAERKKKKKKDQRKKKSAKHPTSDAETSDETSDDDSNGSGKSLRYETLPDWTKPMIKSQIVPSILEHLGAQDNPWDNNTAHETFIQLVQRYIDDVFPHHPYTLRKKDTIYRWASFFSVS